MTNEQTEPQGVRPARGEVWLVRLPRAAGAELQRDRPAVVIQSPTFDAAPVRIIVPLSRWREQFADAINKVEIAANEQNRLDAGSAADFLQVRSVALERFIDRLGSIGTDLVDEIASGVAIAIAGGSGPD